MEDIEIDADRFMSFCIKFKYLGSYFVPVNDTADITERISQAKRKRTGYWQQKDTDRSVAHRLLLEYSTLGSESWH
jgi:hypothetical protein